MGHKFRKGACIKDIIITNTVLEQLCRLNKQIIEFLICVLLTKYLHAQVYSRLYIRVGVKYSTCTWYLYLSTYLSVLAVLEYLVYGNVKVLVLVLVLDKRVLGTYK